MRRDQLVRAAPQRLPNPRDRGDEDVRFSGFNLLHITDIQPDQLRELGLRHADGITLPAHIRTKTFELGIFTRTSRHEINRRNFPVDRNDMLWRNIPTLTGLRV